MLRKFLFLPLFFAMISGSTFANQQMKALFSFNEFHSPEQGAYLETYLTIIGESVSYKANENGKQQANVEVTILIKEGEEIKDFKKYTVTSPEGEHTDFVDQQRFAVPNGVYTMELQLLDLNLEGAEKFTAEQPIVINHPAEKLFTSDVQMIESYTKASQQGTFTKSGYDLVPSMTGYYPEEINELSFYVEVYNADKHFQEDGKFLITYYIEEFERQKTLGQYYRFARQNAGPVNPFLGSFKIDGLGTGNYNLVVEVRNSENTLVEQKKMFFQRNKALVKMDRENLSTIKIENTFVSTMTDADTLLEHIYSMRPICNDIERNIIDHQFHNADLQLMQQFFYSFWLNRDPNDPEASWQEYYAAVKKVDELFGTRVKKGYETDRGEVFLKYGEPNSVSDRPNEPSAYPYQIWHYYKIGRFNNKRFVFYSTDLVLSDYQLLHSDVPGEPQDYQWRIKIEKRNTPGGDIDATSTGIDAYGTRTDDFFAIPR